MERAYATLIISINFTVSSKSTFLDHAVLLPLLLLTQHIELGEWSGVEWSGYNANAKLTVIIENE